MLLAISNIFLIAPLVALHGLPITIAGAIFVGMFASSSLVTFIIKRLDSGSIVSLRRFLGLTFTSNLIWTIPFAIGSLLSLVMHRPQPSLNEFVLGAFFAWSFQLLVINGAFLSSTFQSICIAVIQPAITLFFAWPFTVHPIATVLVYPAILGLLVLIITTVFLLKFKTFRTAGAGINSLQTFQSFLKTWVTHQPASLESYFKRYSKDEPVETKIILANGAPKAALILPGVHPGPFFPVGSYNLSELIYHELRKHDIIPMILHGVGGHERNLPTNDLAKQYATAIATAVTSDSAGLQIRTMRGPVREQIGQMDVTSLGFGNQATVFVSKAPYNTDDLEPAIIDEASATARELGVGLMLVDSHNSIGGEEAKRLEMGKDNWKRVLSSIQSNPEEEFEIGIAHSSELQFEHGSDISDGGIAVLLFRKRGSTSALITADANNAVVPLRKMIFDELKKNGIDSIELCTSDTHKSAARYMTDRGYHALGEDSNLDTLVTAVKKLERLAQGRLSRATVTIINSKLNLPLIGQKSLNDFAALTKETLRFTKAYATGALVSILLVGALALFV